MGPYNVDMSKSSIWIRRSAKERIEKNISQAKEYDNYKPFIWFCVGYIVAILTTIMNPWW